jgi:hypothetical protein
VVVVVVVVLLLLLLLIYFFSCSALHFLLTDWVTSTRLFRNRILIVAGSNFDTAYTELLLLLWSY